MADGPAFDDTVPSVPQPVTRVFDFYAWQAVHPLQPLPGDKVNGEYDRTNATLNNLIARVALIQRDDGQLMNDVVTLDAISDDVMAEIAEEAAGAAVDQAEAAAADATIAAQAAQQAAIDAQNAADQVLAQPIPILPGAANSAVVTDGTGQNYQLKTVLLLLDPNAWDAAARKLSRVSDPAAADDAATKHYVDTAVTAAGGIPIPPATAQVLTSTGNAAGNFAWAPPAVSQADLAAVAVTPPLAADVGKFLKAKAAGVFGWVGLVWADISALIQANISAVATALGLQSGAYTVVGTAATKNIGNNAGDVMTWAGVSAYPAGDGSAITNLPKPAAIGLRARQTVFGGALDVAGAPAYVGAGAGLTPQLLGAATPIRMSFAAGFDANGAVDYLATLAANQNVPVPANVTSYLRANRDGAGNITYDAAQMPPAYDRAYPIGMHGALNHFNGVAGDTVALDDYGVSWILANGAKLENNQAKFGATALGGAGTNNAFAGTTEVAFCGQPFALNPNDGSWTTECWFYLTAYSTGTNVRCLMNGGTNTNSFSWFVGVTTAGKAALWLSSNGTTWNLLAASPGATTVTLNAWHHAALCYDGVTGTYRVYLDGNQEVSFATATPLAALSIWSLGNLVNAPSAPNAFAGYLDEARQSPLCRYPAGTAFVPPAAPFAPEGDFFDTQKMQMFGVTGPSPAAGSPPVLTAKQALYLGDVQAAAAAITKQQAYALNGDFFGSFADYADASFQKPHYLGCTPREWDVLLSFKGAAYAYVPGDLVRPSGIATGATIGLYEPTATRQAVLYTKTGTYQPVYHSKADGTNVLPTANNQIGIHAKRGW